MDWLFTIGAILIGAMFIWNAYEKFKNKAHVLALFKAKKMPKPELMLMLSMVLRAVGGLMVVLNVFMNVGALLLLIVKIPSTFFFSSFWNLKGTAREDVQREFMKDVTIIGALLILIAVGSGY